MNWGDKGWILTPEGHPQRRINIGPDGVSISVWLRFSTIDAVSERQKGDIERATAQRIRETIRRCQDSGVEPFGFAEAAAIRFPTIDDWRRFGWRDRFSEASVGVEVELTGGSSR